MLADGITDAGMRTGEAGAPLSAEVVGDSGVALAWAVGSGRTNMVRALSANVRALLEAGADPNSVD
eukprot:4555022-Pyramimonas_sp.AAC.1